MTTSAARESGGRKPGHTMADDNRAMQEKAATAKDAVADLAGEATHYASHRVSDARETAGDWVSAARDKASDCSDTVVDYVQRNPYKAVGIAVGVGFLVGLFLKRR